MLPGWSELDADVAPVRLVLSSWIPAEGGLREVLDWHLSTSGRMTRARLAVHTGLALGLAPALVVDLAAIAEGVHEASLLVDDVNDCSDRRRGRPPAWIRFGQDRAMLAAIRLLNSAHGLANATARDSKGCLRLPELVGSIVEKALDGQATELAGPPQSWVQYDWIVRRKTGGLMALPLLLPAYAAGLDQQSIGSLQGLAEQIGIIYQIADDLVDGDQFAAWLGADPSPRQRLHGLAGHVRVEAASLAQPLKGALSRLLDDLLPWPVSA